MECELARKARYLRRYRICCSMHSVYLSITHHPVQESKRFLLLVVVHVKKSYYLNFVMCAHRKAYELFVCGNSMMYAPRIVYNGAIYITTAHRPPHMTSNHLDMSHKQHKNS